MAQQNCNVCEFAHCNMGDKDGGHCYMFYDKPKGRCAQFSPCGTKEYRNTKKIARNMFHEFRAFY